MQAGGTQRGSGSGRLILASASPRRRELLRQIGLEPEIAVSLVEEKAQGTPEKVVKELSRQKAGEVARRLGLAGAEDPSSIVIGADTVVAVDGRILGKPADRREAAAMLELLQGRTHLVCTGVTLIGGGRTECFAEKTLVEVYPMTPEEIGAYLDCGEYADKAGAYGIQGRFAAHIRRIDGSYTNVVGLPVGRVWQELKKMRETAAGGQGR